MFFLFLTGSPLPCTSKVNSSFWSGNFKGKWMPLIMWLVKISFRIYGYTSSLTIKTIFYHCFWWRWSFQKKGVTLRLVIHPPHLLHKSKVKKMTSTPLQVPVIPGTWSTINWYPKKCTTRCYFDCPLHWTNLWPTNKIVDCFREDEDLRERTASLNKELLSVHHASMTFLSCNSTWFVLLCCFSSSS
jgi:hypothetical protein